jgi:hypothetical protein
VFSSFILNGDPVVKQFGVGLSSAVFLAAGLVLMLAPAMLTLLGRRAWWMPGFLARIIPVVDIEGTSLNDRPAGGVAEAVAIESEPARPDPAPADAPADGSTPEIVSAAGPAEPDVVRASDAGKRGDADTAATRPIPVSEEPAPVGDATPSPDESR